MTFKGLVVVTLLLLSGCFDDRVAESGGEGPQTATPAEDADDSPKGSDGTHTTPEEAPLSNTPENGGSELEPIDESVPLPSESPDLAPNTEQHEQVPAPEAESPAEEAGANHEALSFVESAFWVDEGDGTLTLFWDSIPEAARYHLYHAKEPFDDFQNYGLYHSSRLILDVSSAYTLSGLTNYRYNYFILTAEIDGLEYPVGEPVAAYARRDEEPTAREIRRLELINRARKYPLQEASRYGLTSLNDGLAPGTLTYESRPPLAFNMNLMSASRLHSNWMLQANVFSHTGENGSNVGDRAEDAGYFLVAPAAVGENLAWQGTTSSSINLTTAIEQHHEGLFLSPGHRANILSGSYREVGVGQAQGYFTHNGTDYLSSILTSKYGASSGRYFITGVAFQVTDSEGLYQPGAALQDVVVQAGPYRYSPTATGVYNILLPAGSHTFSVTVGGLQIAAPETVTITSENVKRDIVSQHGVVHIRAY